MLKGATITVGGCPFSLMWEGGVPPKKGVRRRNLSREGAIVITVSEVIDLLGLVAFIAFGCIEIGRYIEKNAKK